MVQRRLVLFVCLCLAASSAWAQGRGAKPLDAGEVTVVLNEQLLNALLEGMLALDKPPTFPLSREPRAGARCASEVTLARESGGTRTAVRFGDGRIDAPVAFRGTYDAALLGCLSFEGWADTELQLSFDRERQALLGRVRVRSVQLKNVPSLVGGGVTQLVQDAIDRRVNPVELLRAEQLGARIPVSQGNVLRLRAREVRHEVGQKELRLRIFYEVVRGE